MFIEELLCSGLANTTSTTTTSTTTNTTTNTTTSRISTTMMDLCRMTIPRLEPEEALLAMFLAVVRVPGTAVQRLYVKSLHVGGTRCVPSSTDHIMNIQARITLTVEVIRTCIFICLLYV